MKQIQIYNADNVEANNADSFASTKKRALRILGNRNFSENEMYKRLVSKGEPEEAARETVAWLVSLGYINDDSYATLIVSHYFDKGYGEARVRDELNKRGIPREMWEEKLSEATQRENKDGDDTGSDAKPDRAVEYLKKKLRNTEITQTDGRASLNRGDMQRTLQALVRRGFTYDEAKDAINRYLINICKEKEE